MRMVMRAFGVCKGEDTKLQPSASGCDFERRSDGVGKRPLKSGRALNAIRDDDFFGCTRFFDIHQRNGYKSPPAFAGEIGAVLRRQRVICDKIKAFRTEDHLWS